MLADELALNSKRPQVHSAVTREDDEFDNPRTMLLGQECAQSFELRIAIYMRQPAARSAAARRRRAAAYTADSFACACTKLTTQQSCRNDSAPIHSPQCVPSFSRLFLSIVSIRINIAGFSKPIQASNYWTQAIHNSLLRSAKWLPSTLRLVRHQ